MIKNPGTLHEVREVLPGFPILTLFYFPATVSAGSSRPVVCGTGPP